MISTYRRHLALRPLFLFIALPGILAQSSSANEDSKYLDAVRQFADNVLKYGRDTYGPKHTPLFVDGLSVHTHEPVKWIAPNGDRWILSNLASQQNLFRTLDSLSKITGDPKYKQAAMDAIEYAFENLMTPNGLLHWGGHQAYDAAADRPCGRRIHEFKCFYPHYDLMWEVDPKATKRFIEAFWSGHILDWSNLSLNRHASDMTGPLNKPWDYQYKREPTFIRSRGTCDILCGSDLCYAAAWLTKNTGDKQPLLWSKRLAYRFVQTRDPKTRLGTLQFCVREGKDRIQLGNEVLDNKLGPTQEIFPHQNRSNREYRKISPGYDMPTPGAAVIDIIHSPWICQLMLGDLLGAQGKEFIQWAVEEFKARGKVAYRKSDNVFVPVLRDGTSLEGYVCPEDGPLGWKDSTLEPITAGTAAFWAYSLAYCLTRDEFMWEMARNIAIGNQYGDIGANVAEEPQLNLQTEASDPYVIVVFLELYKKTGKGPFLKIAEKIGANVLSGRFCKGFFVPSHKHVYAKFDAIDSLALLHLNSAISGDSDDTLPQVWPARPFLEVPYRSKDNVIDNQLIYTMTDSLDPPLSLNEAAATGKIDLVKSLVEKGTDVNSREGTLYWTALHRASIGGHTDIVNLLLAEGARVEASGGYPQGTALHHASINGHKEIVELLIAKDADVNAKNNDGQTPIDMALQRSHKAVAQLLIEKGADVSLQMAARYGLLDKLKELIASETDIRKPDSLGLTPLYHAARGGQQKIVELLLARGAVVSTIYEAAYLGDLARVKTFIQEGIDINSMDLWGSTALHFAARGGQRDVAELLIAEGANVNAGQGQWTPLQEAAYYSREVVELLLAKKANINTGKWTALHSAFDAERFDIVELLLAKDADTNIRDDQGRTPLHIAAWYAAGKNTKIVELLLAKGPDINAKDNNRKTALSYAIENGHTKIVELLRKHGAKE